MAKKKVDNRDFEIGQKVVLDHSMRVIDKKVDDDGIIQCTCRLELKDGQTMEIILPSHALASDCIPTGWMA